MSTIRNLSLVTAFFFFLSPTLLIAGYVENAPSPGAFQVASASQASSIYMDDGDYAGTVRAAGDLAQDIAKVTGVHAELVHGIKELRSSPILIGTIGKSAIIDRLAKDGKIDIAAIAGKWESFVIQVVPNPLPGVDTALVIAGSDKRGTIYGIYDLSEQMGVSPWYWWADVPVAHRDAIFVRAGRYVQGAPKVKYRGIFINDEEPALGGWSREKFGGINSKMYTRMFELILRLKGNYLWPAMWGKAFSEDDTENPRLADEYGIVMGTSHHEPMMRAQQEWTTQHKGPWNYATNEEELKEFWRFGIARNRSYDDLITIGMRGDGDKPMVENGDMKSNMALLERIVTDQRKMIADVINPDVTKVPQLWALYKEVLDYYEQGMRVPDDVTLLWCDDNWGNIRRLPTPQERNRSGGAGVYYHFDYVGDPRDYKWLNTNPLPKIWEQMNLAYRYGADRIWIVNVGDLKPMELPISFFLKFAWNPDAIDQDQIADFTRQWATQQFGPEHAADIADIVSKYAKYNGWRKPELLEPSTFSLTNYQEADRVLDGWETITKKAEQIYASLPSEQRDAFYELVLYPTKASATVVELYIAAGRNRLYAQQHRASTDIEAEKVRELFKQDQELTDEYNHHLAGGKWDHMMDQTRIGYTSWQDPKENVMPAVHELQVPAVAELGIAVEGSESSWPGEKKEARLPDFDSLNEQKYPIDIFDRGSKPFEFTATANEPWIKVSEGLGTVDDDRRIWTSIDWQAAPVGNATGTITVAQTGGQSVSILVRTVRSSELSRESVNALGGLTGPTAFAVESASANIAVGDLRWIRIPGYGRGASGMSISLVNSASVAPPRSPHLEYRVYISQAGPVKVDAIIGPTLNFMPGRGLRFAVSFDDQQPQVVDVFGESDLSLNKWRDSVRDNVRKVTSTQTVSRAGVHTLKIWMVDPAVVLEKLIVYQGDVRPSYFGPPEEMLAADAPTNGTSNPEPSAVSSRPHPGSASFPSPRKDANSIEAHRQLVAKAMAGGIDLYFLGDSITRRWGCTDAQWAAMFANWKQNFFGWNAGNFGWGADEIQNILWRIQNGELDHVNPKVIVILAGTNNVGNKPGDDKKVANIVEGLRAIVSTCREKAPQAKIILTAIFPRNDSMAVWPEIQRINGEVAKLADGETTFYLNVNNKLANADGVLFDGMTVDRLHPTVKGYQVWADGLQPLLTKLLGPRADTDHAPPATGDPSVLLKAASQSKT